MFWQQYDDKLDEQNAAEAKTRNDLPIMYLSPKYTALF